ncbi:MAG: ISAs1 family transposase, partial [Acetobacteraceae bacterium]
MEDATTSCAAFDESLVFLSYFRDLKDPRQQGKVVYPLDEIVLLCLLAVLAGAETFVDIALFGCKKRELLRRFRSFKDGTPAHDHLGDILAAFDSGQFQRCFVAWTAALTGAPEGVIAIDGKTSRRSGRKDGSNRPIHMVSAFAARQRWPGESGQCDKWIFCLSAARMPQVRREDVEASTPDPQPGFQ